jgi:hypothetical protein
VGCLVNSSNFVSTNVSCFCSSLLWVKIFDSLIFHLCPPSAHVAIKVRPSSKNEDSCTERRAIIVKPSSALDDRPLYYLRIVTINSANTSCSPQPLSQVSAA